MEFSPFVKQCFVVVGVSLNLAQFGLVIGFTALLLPQLRAASSEIPIDYASGSWIASIPSLSLLVGNIIIPVLMGKAGRRMANIVSITIVMIGWFGIVLATNVYVLLAARFVQGISLGMSISSSSVTIAEYTSPKWRGAFLTSLSSIMSLGTLFVHTITSIMMWKSAALVCAAITFLDLMIVICSPETPGWLANQGRYEDCKRVFRLLRCDDEGEELSKLIEAGKALRDNSSNNAQRPSMNPSSLFKTVKKKEFYKPIFIAVHMYIIVVVCGINVLSAYTVDVLNGVTNLSEINVSLVVISLDIQRFITNTAAIFLIKKLKRRTVLFLSGFWNIVSFFIVSGYVLLRSKSILPFDNCLIGVLLLHFLLFSASIGTLPVPFIICGELFPLRYRSISSGITGFLLSICLFTVMKTYPYLTYSIGLSGTFVLYGAVLLYCILIAYFFLPETKDKTLQEIEEEFTGKRIETERQTVVPLMVLQRERN